MLEKNVRDEIRRRNRIFQKASKAEKRVLIAKDVIKQIEKGRILPQAGDFFKICLDPDKVSDDDKFLSTLDPTASLQELFLSETLPACRCCALGSMMITCTLFNNKELVEDITHDFYLLGTTIARRLPIKNGFNQFFS